MSGEVELSDSQKRAILDYLLDEEKSLAILDECDEFEGEGLLENAQPWALAIENFIGQVRSMLRKLGKEKSRI